jgi:serine/threonine protein phosphatase PrpC
MDLSAKIELVSVSDTGRKRPHNEDSAITHPKIGLALVADGMGGYRAGEVASAIAAKAILDVIGSNLHVAQDQRSEHSGCALSKQAVLVRDSILGANRQIFKTATAVPECLGMGTTIVTTLFYNNRVIIAHVGDSRVYRYRDNQLAQVTNDHSLVQELIDRGFGTAEDAEANMSRNIVTRALGIGENVEVDVKEEAALPGDIYLLCSDGLNDMVDDKEIRLTLSKYSGNLVGTAHELVGLANESGGQDNISVVLARPQAPFPAESRILANLMGLLTRGR